MPTTWGHYVPYDYIRVCDLCPARRNISALRRTADGSFVCDFHPDYRTAFELDELNRNTRVPRDRAVPNPKPQDPYNPYTFIEEEGHLLAFVAQMVGLQSRYLDVTSGTGAPVTDDAQYVSTLGWVSYYLNGMVVEGKRPAAMLTRAGELLDSIAASLQARQYGFGLSPSSTIATDPLFGAILEPGTSTVVTDDVIMGGLAMLHAYRETGATTYLLGARAAASYLRNVQAIGRFGVNHTSADSAGVGYLYTGSLCSEVSTAAGFYSNHLFYPSALLALVFWRELMTTDGDQQIGATVAVGGAFSQIPQQLMSTCIADLRACWEAGIQDATGVTVNGLSTSTPREFFNAYPATKSGFLSTGVGLWEFSDGDSTDGTQVTGANFAKAIHALYVTEGASDQVVAVDDWLRAFTSNAEFETPVGTSDSSLARSMTGAYDATKGIATALTVRDADDAYAAIAENGTDLYDWGAFGLLADLWAARHNNTFAAGRRLEVYVNQRWRDGQATDGDHYDELYLLGKSGLTQQTAFTATSSTPPTVDLGCDDSTPPTSPFNDSGLVLWLRADAGVTTAGSNVTRWDDQSGFGQNMTVAPLPPTFVASVLNGMPAVRFAAGTYIERATRLVDRNGVPFFGSKTRTVFVVARPGAAVAGRIGGCLLSFNVSSGLGAYAMYFVRVPSVFGHTNALINHDWWPEWSTPIYSAVGSTVDGQANYEQTPVIVQDRYSGTGNLRRYLNGDPILQSIDGISFAYSSPVSVGDTNNPGPFTVGNVGGFGSYGYGFAGDIFEILVYDTELSDVQAEQTGCYLAGRYNGSIQVSGMVKDAIRASQVGLSFRCDPIANRYPGT